MLVTIRLFARLREIAGASELERTLPDGATARTAWDALVGEFPPLEDYATAVSCAVNEEYARLTATLKDGDEVAFLPPVSGGSSERVRLKPDTTGFERGRLKPDTTGV
jgi:molybdopterin converting factor subunit 1